MSRSADGPSGPGRAPFDPGARAARKARAAPVGAPYLFPLGLVLVALAVGWALRDRISLDRFSSAALSPEGQVREALSRQRRASLPDVYGFASGGVVELDTLRYVDPAVMVDGDKAQVIALLDGDGRVAWRASRATVAYVGREAFGMSRCSVAGWCADGRQFDGLRGVLAVLFRRQDALAAGDARALLALVSERYAGEGGKAALAARLRGALAAPAPVSVDAWQIRVDRDEAIVGEDVQAPLPGGGQEPRRARFTLAREADRWRFVDGL
ncbi:MAG: nuclear transport factor 2 family protein [Anaeromyxobacter sp.]